MWTPHTLSEITIARIGIFFQISAYLNFGIYFGSSLKLGWFQIVEKMFIQILQFFFIWNRFTMRLFCPVYSVEWSVWSIYDFSCPIWVELRVRHTLIKAEIYMIDTMLMCYILIEESICYYHKSWYDLPRLFTSTKNSIWTYRENILCFVYIFSLS